MQFFGDTRTHFSVAVVIIDFLFSCECTFSVVFVQSANRWNEPNICGYNFAHCYRLRNDSGSKRNNNKKSDPHVLNECKYAALRWFRQNFIFNFFFSCSAIWCNCSCIVHIAKWNTRKSKNNCATLIVPGSFCQYKKKYFHQNWNRVVFDRAENRTVIIYTNYIYVPSRQYAGSWFLLIDHLVIRKVKNNAQLSNWIRWWIIHITLLLRKTFGKHMSLCVIRFCQQNWAQNPCGLFSTSATHKILNKMLLVLEFDRPIAGLKCSNMFIVHPPSWVNCVFYLIEQ